MPDRPAPLRTFDRSALLALLAALEEFAGRLADHEIGAGIRVIGGAAIARARDNGDIRTLLTACGVSSAYEAEEIFAGYYPGEDLKPRARLLLAHCFPSRDQAPA